MPSTPPPSTPLPSTPLTTTPFTSIDEGRHADVAVEAWWWWGWSHDGTCAVYAGLELRGRRFDYWAGLLRAGEPYLYVEELDGTGLRDGLEIKPPQMWADHQCDVPFRQWSIGNEAHGVLLDDPSEAWRRAYGQPVPVTFDVEWYGTAEPEAIEHGYAQSGDVDADIELTEGIVSVRGPAHRVHVWGVPYLPRPLAMPVAAPGLRGPYRRSDGQQVDQVVTRQGLHVAVASATR